MLKLTFLGTGTSQGVPMIGCDCRVCRSCDKRDRRLRSSVMIEIDGTVIVIDSSSDFRYQMLRNSVKHLDAIIVTHPHKDHIGGMDDVRAFNYIQSKPMDVYAEKISIEVIKKDFDYAFSDHRYPGVPEIMLHEIDCNEFFIKGVKIIPIRGFHYKMPVLGFRIENMCYITDMNRIEDKELNKIKGVDVLVINALRKEKHISHFTLEQAIEVINKVSPKKAYITHISHQMGLYGEEQPLLPNGVEFAYDGLTLNI